MNILRILLLISICMPVMAQFPTKVLIIGVDGVRSDALIQASTPHIDSLTAYGTYTYTSWHPRTTLSGPSWSDLLTGVWEEKHEVLNNSYTNKNWDDYPYFVTRAKEYRPDIKAVQITSWAPMSDSVYNDGWDSKLVLPSDNSCVIATIDTLTNNPDLDVLFVHIDDVDHTGHASGFDPSNSNYMDAIETVDGQVGQIMAALKARPQFDNESWIVLLTTDHGGIFLGHGGITGQERQVWWIGWSNKGVFAQQEYNNDLSNLSNSDYTDPDEADFSDAPLLVDIAVTAIDHLLPEVDPDTLVSWDLDGRSWLKETLPTSVNAAQIKQTDGKLFPNPTQGKFSLTMQHVEGDVSYRLFDVNGHTIATGEQVFTDTSLNIDFDISDQPNGVYLLEVTHGGRSTVNRVVKK